MSLADHTAPSTKDANPYVQRRALLHRIGDMKPFNGWVEEIRERQVRIRLGASKQELSLGDKLSVEVAGKEHTAMFVGEVVLASDWIVELAITEGVDLLPKNESPRINMFGERCKIYLDGAEITAISVDISACGLGLVLTSELEPGTTFEFEVGTQLGTICGTGTILYSRADPFSVNRYRAGIEVSGLKPADQERWSKLQDFPTAPW